MRRRDGLKAMSETILSNARIVLRDEIVEGTVAMRNGVIHDYDSGGSSLSSAIDCEGDYLMPGLVELHTDNLEKHMLPRPKAHWPAIPAVVAHDMQIIAAGITTVFDAIAIGAVNDDPVRIKRLGEMIDAIHEAQSNNLVKSQHLLHLRCEISFPEIEQEVSTLIDKEEVRLVSIMDHTPGQRQFADEETYKNYYMSKYGMNADEMDAFIKERRRDQKLHAERNRRSVVSMARERGLALASHDDANAEHVAEAVGDGMTIAEFPTTIEAADASHAHGLAVLMGAPNIVRGGSHSGNVSAMELAERGILDVISSDYAPAALLHAAMMLPNEETGITLPEAIATVTETPARAAGLEDRGVIAQGMRADVIRVHDTDHPTLLGVWREGQRVA